MANVQWHSLSFIGYFISHAFSKVTESCMSSGVQDAKLHPDHLHPLQIFPKAAPKAPPAETRPIFVPAARPAAPTDCSTATALPAATPPPPAMADADIQEAAMLPPATPPAVNPSADTTSGTVRGSVAAPTAPTANVVFQPEAKNAKTYTCKHIYRRVESEASIMKSQGRQS